MLTVLVTILSGVTIFVIGQILQKIYIEPLQQIQKTIGEIGVALTYYANTYANVPGIDTERLPEARYAFRKLSGRLRGELNIIPYFHFWRRIAHLPDPGALIEASNRLILLSNSVGANNSDTFDQALRDVSTYIGISNHL